MDPEGNPEGFLCPITRELFTDPVVASDGHTYEQSAISQWLESHRTSPLTRTLLSTTDLLRPNFALRTALEDWRTRQATINNLFVCAARDGKVDVVRALLERGVVQPNAADQVSNVGLFLKKIS